MFTTGFENKFENEMKHTMENGLLLQSSVFLFIFSAWKLNPQRQKLIIC